MKHAGYKESGKRKFDFVLSTFALTALSPLMLAVAVLIKVEDGGPVIFKQKRVGQNGDPFEFLKFRSMPIATEDVSSEKAKHLNITRIGKVIRRTNIDELPQLINILRGEMSIVGPRPPIPAQQDLCRLRTENNSITCKPGLTGLAQVNSFDGMSAEDKARWDGEYAREVSLGLDLKIILQTVAYLFKPPPVY